MIQFCNEARRCSGAGAVVVVAGNVCFLFQRIKMDKATCFAVTRDRFECDLYLLVHGKVVSCLVVFSVFLFSYSSCSSIEEINIGTIDYIRIRHTHSTSE